MNLEELETHFRFRDSRKNDVRTITEGILHRVACLRHNLERKSRVRSEDRPSDSSNTIEYRRELARRGPATIVFQEFCPPCSAKTFRFVSLLIQENQSIQPL